VAKTAGRKARQKKIKSAGLPNLATPHPLNSAAPISAITSLPIDPWEEKRAAERDKAGYIIHLMRKAGIGAVRCPQGGGPLNSRIKEVYRLCFRFKGGKDVSVLSDFAAHYPELALNCEWLAKAAKSNFYLWADYPDLKGDRSARSRILNALANGLRRAARPKGKRELRLGALAPAHFYLQEVKAELIKFCELEVPRQPWGRELEKRIRAKVRERVGALVSEDGRLGPIQPKLEELLLQRRPYKAALKIAATLFYVRERSLQDKPP
jgi:hypothetical protein